MGKPFARVFTGCSLVQELVNAIWGWGFSRGCVAQVVHTENVTARILLTDWKRTRWGKRVMLWWEWSDRWTSVDEGRPGLEGHGVMGDSQHPGISITNQFWPTSSSQPILLHLDSFFTFTNWKEEPSYRGCITKILVRTSEKGITEKGKTTSFMFHRHPL